VPFPIYFENGRVGIGEQTPEAELDVVGDVAVSGDLDVAGTITQGGAPIGGVTLGAVGSTPNANGATLTGSELSLEPASASFPGVVTTGAQTLAGAKTLANDLTLTTGVVNSSVADGASAVAHEFDTVALSTSGAKIASFRNNNTEKLSVDKDGNLLPGSALGANLGSGALPFNNAYVSVLTDGALPRLSIGGGGPSTYADSTFSPGAATIAHVFRTRSTFPTAGGKLVSFQNLTTEKAFIDKDGNIEVVDVGTGFILKSPDGTRYKITVANGGALSTTPA
jgi:hypothetical protein